MTKIALRPQAAARGLEVGEVDTTGAEALVAEASAVFREQAVASAADAAAAAGALAEEEVRNCGDDAAMPMPPFTAERRRW
jgi:hypothetical protein